MEKILAKEEVFFIRSAAYEAGVNLSPFYFKNGKIKKSAIKTVENLISKDILFDDIRKVAAMTRSGEWELNREINRLKDEWFLKGLKDA